MDRFSAYLTRKHIQRDHFIPVPDQKMLKVDRLLGADSPALPAAGALGHVVLEGPPAVSIARTQSRRRTIFDTSQAAVAIVVYAKIRQNASP
jgi:hypothetical protein